MSKNAAPLDEADYVIVGTGAGGATAARVLTEAGLSVVLIEEGPSIHTTERPRALLDAMRLSFRDFGTTTTSGSRPFPILQGRMVGGSTAINSGILWRMPEDVRVDWSENYGLSELVEERALERAFEVLEDEMHAEETPRAIWGGNIEKMAEACERLGLPGKPMTRNTRGCEGSGHCLQGCTKELRQSMDVSYVPRAIAKGARLHDLCRVTKVLVERGRAVGVVGERLDRESRKACGSFVVRARRGVIVAAGAVHTPAVLQRTGLGGVIGERFQLHPGTAVIGRFDDAIAMSFGATQGYEVPMRDRGFKLESLVLPPEMLATRLPGSGAEWQARLAELDKYAQWCAIVRMKAHGRVRATRFGGVDIRFAPLPEDLARAQEAAALLCRMMFEVGATEVYPGIGGRPDMLTDVSQVDAIARGAVRPGEVHLMASHLFGTACAGNDPARSAVSPSLESHDVRSLFVMDASVFPTNLGVNPQHSIMAVVWRAAEKLANEARKAA